MENLQSLTEFNFIGVAVITAVFLVVGAAFMDVRPGVQPAWAQAAATAPAK
jgi:hypothetical protein